MRDNWPATAEGKAKKLERIFSGESGRGGWDALKAMHELSGPNHDNWVSAAMQASQSTDLMKQILRVFALSGIEAMDDPVNDDKRARILSPLASPDFTAGLQVCINSLRAFTHLEIASVYENLRLAFRVNQALLNFSADALERLPIEPLKMRIEGLLKKVDEAPAEAGGSASVLPRIKERVQELLADVQELAERAETAMERKARARHAAEEAKTKAVTGDLLMDPSAYRSLSVIPSALELSQFDADRAIRRLPSNGIQRYPSVEHLLGTHFHLLREDAINSFRSAIAIIHEGLSHAGPSDGRDSGRHRGRGAGAGATEGIDYRKVAEHAWVYGDVTVTQPRFDSFKEGIGWRICFSVLPKPKREVVWERTSRLMNGSLIALSADGFQTIVFATVLSRDDVLLNHKAGPFVDIMIDELSKAAFDR
jgi:hypothetical protein